MDLKYFKSQICDEIDGANDYIEKAIEIKPMNPDWAKQFVQMSDMEKEHATTLYSMFNTYVEKLQAGYKETPEFITECADKVKKIYNNGMAIYATFYSAYQKI